MADILTLSPAGTQKFNVDDSGNVTVAGTLGVTGVATFTAAPVINGSPLDVNAKIDQDIALTAAGVALDVAATANNATAAMTGVQSAIATVTTVHSSGVIAAFKASVTSLAGDTGGDFAALEIVSVDGGGTTPTHVGIYCADPLDALIKVAADGDGGFVVGATMTVSPEATAESGYFKVMIGSTVYQCPIYAA